MTPEEMKQQLADLRLYIGIARNLLSAIEESGRILNGAVLKSAEAIREADKAKEGNG